MVVFALCCCWVVGESNLQYILYMYLLPWLRGEGGTGMPAQGLTRGARGGHRCSGSVWSAGRTWMTVAAGVYKLASVCVHGHTGGQGQTENVCLCGMAPAERAQHGAQFWRREG